MAAHEGDDDVRPADRRRHGIWERHGQSALLVVLTMMAGWAGNRLTETYDSVAALKGDVKTLSETTTRLRTELDAARDDSYRRIDADRDFNRVDRRFDGLETRMSNLESKGRR